VSDWSEKQFLALTAGIVGGVLLIAAGVLYYKYSSYSELVQKIEATDREVKGLEKEANRLDEVKKRLEDESALNAQLEARVPEDANVDAFISQINEQSRSAHIIVKGIQVVVGQTHRGPVQRYEPITIKVDCVGGYHELGQFIHRLERSMERLVAISSFKIDAFSDGLEPGKKASAVALEIRTYKFNDPSRPQAAK
jgi:Tfp pilus assembly protein PilO